MPGQIATHYVVQVPSPEKREMVCARKKGGEGQGCKEKGKGRAGSREA